MLHIYSSFQTYIQILCCLLRKKCVTKKLGADRKADPVYLHVVTSQDLLLPAIFNQDFPDAFIQFVSLVDIF